MGLAGYYTYQFQWAEDKSSLLIGETTHGHHQIELACNTCHTEAFGGTELIQEACVSCHGLELDIARDSHPKKKFTDPRNADRVAILDARQCITCHAEHDQENTLAMGVTIQQDYCFYCHQDVAENRPSHKGMEFETCATSGCHNYHDNRALYEDFLIEHGKKPAIAKQPLVPTLTSLSKTITRELQSLKKENENGNQNNSDAISPADSDEKIVALEPADADAPSEHMDSTALIDWHNSVHAQQGINCSSCHQPDDAIAWIEKPAIAQCKNCHEFEAEGFLSGKHGMRLSQKMANTIYQNSNAITPAESPSLTFNEHAKNNQQGCSTCHNSHTFDTQTAAIDSCLSCHSDEHSLAFKQSPHFALWEKEHQQLLPAGSGVSCATCHLPREIHKEQGVDVVRVQHNQNFNLRPNEKMIRSVCMNCHGLSFAIDALADSELIKNNFSGLPSKHIQSIDMAFDRLKEQPSQ